MEVDLEQFYNEDPRRRHSEELEFGREWTTHGGRCEVSWIEATGEVYAMVEPTAQYWADGLGGTHKGAMETSDLVVELIGVVPGRPAIESVMSGWEQAMPGEDSLNWVRQRVANAASELGDPPATPSDDMPSH
jgi:hypothetical protein